MYRVHSHPAVKGRHYFIPAFFLTNLLFLWIAPRMDLPFGGLNFWIGAVSWSLTCVVIPFWVAIKKAQKEMIEIENPLSPERILQLRIMGGLLACGCFWVMPGIKLHMLQWWLLAAIIAPFVAYSLWEGRYYFHLLSQHHDWHLFRLRKDNELDKLVEQRDPLPVPVQFLRWVGNSFFSGVSLIVVKLHKTLTRRKRLERGLLQNILLAGMFVMIVGDKIFDWNNQHQFYLILLTAMLFFILYSMQMINTRRWLWEIGVLELPKWHGFRRRRSRREHYPERRHERGSNIFHALRYAGILFGLVVVYAFRWVVISIFNLVQTRWDDPSSSDRWPWKRPTDVGRLRV